MSIPERPVKILVVDDEDQIRRALRTILGSRGYVLTMAATAEDALMKAIDEPPDLVVLDLMLPDRSGIEVCRELRTWTSVPILILSALNEPSIVASVLDMGADDFLTKPCPSAILVAHLKKLVRRTESFQHFPHDRSRWRVGTQPLFHA